MPPMNCVSARHSRMPLGTPSSTGMTEAPVVVMPDTASNTAATGDATTPDSTNGAAPARPAHNHPNVTTPSPSRRDSSWSLRVKIHRATATASVPAPE